MHDEASMTFRYAIDRHSVQKQVRHRNCSSATTTVLALVNTAAHALKRGKKQIMSALSSDLRETFDALSLSVLLEPMQFKAVLMVTCGLEIHQVAQCLGTTEQTIRNVLSNAYDRTGCRNSDELVRRYFCEVTSSLLELGRLQRELAELEVRVAQVLRRLPETQIRHI